MSRRRRPAPIVPIRCVRSGSGGAQRPLPASGWRCDGPRPSPGRRCWFASHSLQSRILGGRTVGTSIEPLLRRLMMILILAATASPGSAAWAEWVVDGDLAHEIDAREIPPDWSTGYTPLDRVTPFPQPVPDDGSGTVYQLDPGLVDWAWRLTKDVTLPDGPTMAKS